MNSAPLATKLVRSEQIKAAIGAVIFRSTVTVVRHLVGECTTGGPPGLAGFQEFLSRIGS
jgi:hypothetical protein